MTRNYTLVRSYLLEPENLRKTLYKIDAARSETWRNGWSTSQLEEKCKKINAKYRDRVKDISDRIERIDDKNLRILLRKRYLEFKTGQEIMRIMNWSEKFVRSLHERALMNMEIILLEDGIFTFVDPMADMVADYQDGYEKGRGEGLCKGRKLGYTFGYANGYNRGIKGLPFDESEDEYDDYEEKDEYDDYEEKEECDDYDEKDDYDYEGVYW